MPTRRTLLHAAAAGALAPATARAQQTQIRIGLQYGVTYLPFAVMQHESMIERHAKEAGLGQIQVDWNRSAGGNVLNDALLAGRLDCCATGFPSFLILWAKGRGKLAIKGLASYGNTPLLLLTRNPAVKTVADFGDADRITVPAVKSSIQAILLQMAADKIWGQYDRLDRRTISRGHPDALAAVLSMMGEIDSAFSAPPYQYQALERPGIHVVTTSDDIFGGPLSNGLLYMTEVFHDANPAIVKAVNGALREALAFVDTDSAGAARMYIETTGEKIDPALALKTITAPGTKFEATPRGTMQFAAFMQRTGQIARLPVSWRDVFFTEANDLTGT